MAKFPEIKVDVMGLDEVKALVEENKRLRDELNALKKLERERWEGAAKAFGLKEKGNEN